MKCAYCGKTLDQQDEEINAKDPVLSQIYPIQWLACIACRQEAKETVKSVFKTAIDEIEAHKALEKK